MTTLPREKLEYWFIFQGERLLLINQSQIPMLDFAHGLKEAFVRKHQVAEFDDFIVYCAELPVSFTLPAEIELVSLRKALELLDKNWYNFSSKAFAIINWDRNHQFCGRCGHQTVHKEGAFERVCPHCSLAFYPRISPSIIVLIQKGNEILMARSPHFLPGAYGLIAGFVESGESLEEAVHREVKEETSLKIKDLRYFGSQPWPFPDSLMIAFTANYASGDLTINEKEIEDAGWYTVDNIPGRPSSSISIAKKLVDYFIDSQKKIGK